MKKHLLTLIIGILIGAIITTAVFLIIKSKDSQRTPNFEGMQNFEQMGGNRKGNRNNSNETVENKIIEDFDKTIEDSNEDE